MDLVLYDTIDEQVKNYPRADNEPVVGLDPRYLVLTVVREDAPAHDVETHYLKPTRTVDLDLLEWQWGWEIEELIPEPPEPDWRTFKQTLLAHPAINALLTTAITQAPAAVISLPATLLAAADGGDLEDFRAAWLSLRDLELVTDELLEFVRGLAIGCNLPDEFVLALGEAE